MTKTKSTKRALLLSALSLLMCVSMLVGSTFAWFTDSATSANNKIVAGTLDVELYMWNGTTYENISETSKPIFGEGSIAQNNNAETLWEPGKTQVAYLKIVNNGNLALNYTVGLNVQNVSKDLYEVMQYAITPDAKDGTGVTAWDTTNAQSVVLGTQTVSGATPVTTAPNAEHYFALSIHMDEMAGNKYQGGEVNFDLTVLANQAPVESDSFNNQYDANANVYNVTDTASAQKALDAAEDGAVINFAAGDYGMLYFRQSEASEVVEGYDYVQSEYDEVKIRTIKNLTINGNGAKIAGFATEAACYYNGNAWHSNEAKYPILESFIVLENIKIDNVAFTGTANAISVSGKTSVDGLTVTNCTMNPVANVSPKYVLVSAVPNGAQPEYTNVNGETFKVKFANVTIDHCSGSYIDRLVLAHISENLTVTNCKLSNADNHFINLQGATGWNVAHTGTITITDNDFTNGHDRFFRAAKVGNAHLVIERNDVFSAFYNNNEPDDELVKVDVVAGTNVTYTNVDNGFGSYTVVVH